MARNTDGDPQRLNDLLMRAARSLRRRWAGVLEPSGLTPHHARALQVVSDLEGARLGAIADRLRITPRSATEVVDALETRSLVSREPDPGDRRAVCVLLTTEGRAELERVEAARRAMADDHFARLTDAERSSLLELLAKLDDRPAPSSSSA